MSSTKRTARSTGVLYLLMGLPAPFCLLYLPGHFIVPGDATATAGNIAGGALTYRLAILSGLVSATFFLALVMSLYNLLKDVDRQQARLMVMFVSIAVAIAVVDLVILTAPLILLGGARFLSVFSPPQLSALALACLRLRGAELGVASAFWGLWLLPFGILVIRSGFIPRWIGVLLIVGCFAYIAQSVTSIVFPQYMRAVSAVTLPLAAPGEVFMVVWLLARGGRVALPEVSR